MVCSYDILTYDIVQYFGQTIKENGGGVGQVLQWERSIIVRRNSPPLMVNS